MFVFIKLVIACSRKKKIKSEGETYFWKNINEKLNSCYSKLVKTYLLVTQQKIKHTFKTYKSFKSFVVLLPDEMPNWCNMTS